MKNTQAKAMLNFEKHRIYTFMTFAVPFEQGMERRMGELAVEAGDKPQPDLENIRDTARKVGHCVPERLRAGLLGRDRVEKFFEEDGKRRGPDLFLPANRLVSGKKDYENRDQTKCRVYKLTAHAEKFLNTGKSYDKSLSNEEKFDHQLVMLLTKASQRRLASSASDGNQFPSKWIAQKDNKDVPFIPLAIEDIHVFHFATGQAVCQITLEAKLHAEDKINSSILSEMVDHCSRFSNLGWIKHSIKTIRDDHVSGDRLISSGLQFTLGSLIARMICGPYGTVQRSFRSYTHTYGQISTDGAPSEHKVLQGWSKRLARQYTSDYAFLENTPRVEVVADFDNVIHACAQEGSATIVDPRIADGTIPDHLKDYITRSIEPSYLPIVVLNLHLLVQSLEISTKALLRNETKGVFDNKQNKSSLPQSHFEQMKKAWQELEEDFQNLTTFYRFTTISKISMQNDFNKALRNVFSLESFEDTLTRDLSTASESVRTTSALMAEDNARQLQVRNRRIEFIVTLSLIAIFSMEALITVEDILKEGFGKLETIWLTISILVLIVGFFWLRNQWKIEDIKSEK